MSGAFSGVGHNAMRGGIPGVKALVSGDKKKKQEYFDPLYIFTKPESAPATAPAQAPNYSKPRSASTVLTEQEEADRRRRLGMSEQTGSEILLKP